MQPNPPTKTAGVRIIRLYANDWGARVRMRGGWGRVGQVTPPACNRPGDVLAYSMRGRAGPIYSPWPHGVVCGAADRADRLGSA